MVGDVQRSWSFLENLFIHSEEVKKELPEESRRFINIDKDVRTLLADGYNKQKAIVFCNQDYVLPQLEKIEDDLAICEKALNEFMYSKKVAFPRFFFVSSADLLDILSNGNNPQKIMVHMPKIISALDTLELKKEGQYPIALGMKACVGVEYVKFVEERKLVGKVECYLQDVIDTMRESLREISKASLKKFGTLNKEEWLVQDPAQVTLLINLCSYVQNVEKAFNNLTTDKEAIRSCHKHQVTALKGLVMMVQGDLTKPVRQKIMCLITMDAHSRDILDKLDVEKVMRSDEFQW